MKIVPLQCSACRLLRANRLEESKKWLDETEEEINRHSYNKKLVKEDLNLRLSYFYLIKGAYLFKTEEYIDAEEFIKKSLDNLDRSRKFNLVEKSFAYYMLHEIGKINNTNTHPYGSWALDIMDNSIRRNYCLFDFEQIHEKLRKELKFKDNT